MKKLPVFLIVVAVVLLYALYRKGDVKAGIKTPILEFSLDTKDRPPTDTKKLETPSSVPAKPSPN